MKQGQCGSTPSYPAAAQTAIGICWKRCCRVEQADWMRAQPQLLPIRLAALHHVWPEKESSQVSFTSTMDLRYLAEILFRDCGTGQYKLLWYDLFIYYIVHPIPSLSQQQLPRDSIHIKIFYYKIHFNGLVTLTIMPPSLCSIKHTRVNAVAWKRITPLNWLHYLLQIGVHRCSQSHCFK